jgi:hypothetical protein
MHTPRPSNEQPNEMLTKGQTNMNSLLLVITSEQRREAEFIIQALEARKNTMLQLHRQQLQQQRRQPGRGPSPTASQIHAQPLQPPKQPSQPQMVQGVNMPNSPFLPQRGPNDPPLMKPTPEQLRASHLLIQKWSEEVNQTMSESFYLD